MLDDDTVDLDALAFVANSNAVQMLTRGATNAAKIRSLAETGVAFKACSNSLRRASLSPDRLLDDVAVVSSGVGELTRLQTDGF